MSEVRWLKVVVFVLISLAACSSGDAPEQNVALPLESIVAPKVERRWERIYGNELFRLIEERPLAWLPVGVIERHGEHLPWGEI